MENDPLILACWRLYYVLAYVPHRVLRAAGNALLFIGRLFLIPSALLFEQIAGPRFTILTALLYVAALALAALASLPSALGVELLELSRTSLRWADSL